MAIINKEKNFVSAVVYINNSANEVEEFLEKVDKVLDDNFEHFEIICVNDASKDDSAKIIKDVSYKLPSGGTTSLINLSYPQGIEAAMNAGVDLAIGDFVFEFDTVNIDYNEQLIMDIYNKSLSGYDIVSAVSNRKKSFTSNQFYKIFNKYANMQYELTTETFRVISRRAINRVQSMTKTIPYRKALYANSGLKYKTLEYTPISSVKNNKATSNERIDLAVDSIILFTNFFYKFSFVLSFIMIFVTVMIAIYTIVTFLTISTVAGWTTTMLFLSFAFSGLFILNGIIIKYLDTLVSLVFQKQKYNFESIDKISKSGF